MFEEQNRIYKRYICIYVGKKDHVARTGTHIALYVPNNNEQ